MNIVKESNGAKERSPSYPFISLQAATERLAAFDKWAGRHSAPIDKVGLAWKLKENSSQASQTLSTLKSFGLLNYENTGNKRSVVISEDGRTYLLAKQESVKQDVLRRCATKPKAIAKYWDKWGADRPHNDVCLDALTLHGGFTKSAAQTFLKVYDETIAFSGLANSDNMNEYLEEEDSTKIEVGDLIQWESGGQLQFSAPKRVRAIQNDQGLDWIFVEGSNTGIPMSEVNVEQKNPLVKPELIPPTLPESSKADGELPSLKNEREFLRGPLSKIASYRLLVSGELGPKEIGKLITMLEAQKGILEDEDEDSG